jgi:hypothetical protein
MSGVVSGSESGIQPDRIKFLIFREKFEILKSPMLMKRGEK